jgi:hypothetical protein
MSPRRRSRAWPLVALLPLVAGGCFRWAPVSLEGVRQGRVELRTRTVRVSAAGEEATLAVHRVTPAHLDGYDLDREVERRVPWSRVRALRARETDPLGSALAVGAVYFTVGLLGWLALVVDPL